MTAADSAGAWKGAIMELEKGARVWVKTSPEQWVLGTLQHTAGAVCSVALDTEWGEGTGDVLKAAAIALAPANPLLLERVNDLTALSYLNEPSLLHNLRQRYVADQIHTHAGPVLIVVNPFKQVPELYTAEVLEQYAARQGSESSQGYEPHIFLTADVAYKEMCRCRRSQSIIINGESGAGKTETTKIAMRYLAGLAGGTGVEDQVLATNPLLEAFGNAKTLRNNNSSRFGKLIQIYFNNANHICGAVIQTYLLEKSRVAHQLPGERNYHIFYQLCKGASAEERAAYAIPEAPDSFAYLGGSGCTTIAGVDDAAELRRVKTAMTAVGIDAAAQGQVWALLSAVMWLGNVEFRVRGDDSVEVGPGPALAQVAALLHLPPAALATALCRRTITAGGETIQVGLKQEAARTSRDALAKALYSALFSWLVARINAALSAGKRRAEDALSLSILDIYGFECFKENSFEQLCINYANERLQQQFNKHLFKLEQEVYASEGIDWTHIAFDDNQLCVDLIDSRPPKPVGILSLLDEECIYPKATDTTFSAKLRENLAGNPHFGVPKMASAQEFKVAHFAGDVVYNCRCFLDKNRDTLSQDLIEAVAVGQGELVAALAAQLRALQVRRAGQTVGLRFREQLHELIIHLDRTMLHFVRCIKPNGQQVASKFDSGLALHQLVCGGVLEVTRIARAGYPTRYLHRHFAERYHVLLPSSAGVAVDAGNALAICQQVLQEFRIPQEEYQVGQARLFFRAGVLGRLEDLTARIHRAVLVMQSRVRMVRWRRSFLALRAAATTAQAHLRAKQARAAYAVLLRRHHAAMALQAHWRGLLARQACRHRLQAIVTLQRAVRCRKVRKAAAQRLAASRQQEAAAVAAAAALRQEEEEFEAIKARFGVNNRGILDTLLAWQQHGAEFGAWREAGGSGELAAWRQHRTQFLAWFRAAPDSPTASGFEKGRDVGEEAEGSSGESEQSGWRSGRPSSSGTAAAEQEATSLPATPTDPADAAAAIAEAREQVALWEEYAVKLEAHVEELSSEMAELQDQVAALRSHLTPDSPGQQQLIAAHHGSELGTPSSQSVPTPASDCITFTGAWPKVGEEKGVEGGAGGERLQALQQELTKRRPMFLDDASFIREVKAGVAQTQIPMSPEAELDNLRASFAAFKRDFKAQLEETARVLKRADRGPASRKASFTSSTGSGGGGGAGTQRGAAGSHRILALHATSGAALDMAGDAVKGGTKARGLMARLSFRKALPT